MRYRRFTAHNHHCSGLPRVRFVCGAVEVMKRERWMFKASGGLYLSRQQLPLKLAWAISIHKSQVSPALFSHQESLNIHVCRCSVSEKIHTVSKIARLFCWLPLFVTCCDSQRKMTIRFLSAAFHESINIVDDLVLEQ